MRADRTAKANIASGCILNDSVTCPWSKSINDLPNPQPGQCSNPASFSGHRVKCSPELIGDKAKNTITANQIKASRLRKTKFPVILILLIIVVLSSQYF